MYVFIDYSIRCIHHDDHLFASLTYLKLSGLELGTTSLNWTNVAYSWSKLCIVIIMVMNVKSTAYSTGHYYQ